MIILSNSKNSILSRDELKRLYDQPVNLRNVYVGNKIIPEMHYNERQFLLSLYKELFYKLENGMYVSMSDISFLNSFVSKDSWTALDFFRYFETDGILIDTYEYTEDCSGEKQAYIANLERFRDFNYKCDFDQLYKFLAKLNNYSYPRVKKNIIEEVGKQNLYKTYFVANHYSLDHATSMVNKDNQGIILSKSFRSK